MLKKPAQAVIAGSSTGGMGRILATFLFALLATATPMDGRFITEFGGDLPEYAPVSGFVAAMAALDRSWSHLQLLHDNDWTTPVYHPDLVATAEAGIMHDSLRIAAQDNDVTHRPDDFRRRLEAAVEDSLDLEHALLRSDHAAANEAMVRLSRSCTGCHAAYRND